MSIKLTVQEACIDMSKKCSVFSTHDIHRALDKYGLDLQQVTTTMTRLAPDFLLRVSRGRYMLRHDGEALKVVNPKVYRSDIYTETCFVEADGETWGINHWGGSWLKRFSVDLDKMKADPIEVSRGTAIALLTFWGARPVWTDEQPAGQF